MNGDCYGVNVVIGWQVHVQVILSGDRMKLSTR
jgi:hypothetical protein